VIPRASAHCFLDESGYVGFAETLKSQRTDPKAFGVLAGLCVRGDVVEGLESHLAELLAPCTQDCSGKAHATELFRDGTNSQVRDRVFEYLASRGECLIVYEAVYAMGLLDQQEAIRAIVEQVQEDHSAFRTSANRSKARVMTELLTGIVFQLDTICYFGGVSGVRLWSDRIDRGLLAEAKAEVKRLKLDKHETRMTAWDEETGAVVEGKLRVCSPNFDNRTSRVLGVDLNRRHPSLGLTADMIANSIRHYLKLRIDRSSDFPPLHDQASLSDFTLKDQVANLREGYFTDLCYRPDSRPWFGQMAMPAQVRKQFPKRPTRRTHLPYRDTGHQAATNERVLHSVPQAPEQPYSCNS